MKIAAGLGDRLDLLLSDVVMPGFSGVDIATRVQKGNAGVKVLLMSGYTSFPSILQGQLGPGLSFLQKPFTKDSLARKVREVLDG